MRSKNTLSKDELELLGYTNVGAVDGFIDNKWHMEVQGFWAVDKYGRDIKYYISIIELHARLSMIDGYSTYNGSKPTKEGK